MVLSGISELFLMASSVPFISFLMGNGVANAKFQIIDLGTFGSNEDQFIYTVVIFMTAVTTTVGLRVVTLFQQTKTIYTIGNILNSKLFNHMLTLPFLFHLNENSSKFMSSLSVKTNIIIQQALSPSLQIISALITFCVIAYSLMYIAIKMTLILLFIFAVLYVVIGALLKVRFSKISITVSTFYDLSMKLLKESFAAIRIVKLDHLETYLGEKYRLADKTLKDAQGESQFLSSIPRITVEGIGLLALATLTILQLLYFKWEDFPLQLGICVLGLQRLLPHFQVLFQAWSGIKIAEKSVDELIDLLSLTKGSDEIGLKSSNLEPLNSPEAPLIEFKDVSAHYGVSTETVLKNINVMIFEGESIGIIGKSGSGKSTFLDLLSGLITPSDGSIIAVGRPLNASSEQFWRQKISYMGQETFVWDDTVIENITLGKTPINQQLLDQSLYISCFDEVLTQLGEGLDAIVGENGSSLSGGQRQRLGLARAIYNSKSILILDEATSSLDLEIEQKFLRRLSLKLPQITTIQVAHKTSALKYCTRILEFNNGIIIKDKKQSHSKNIINNTSVLF
jgi:ATP-binding cassette, subfamily B, bacterial PglK